MGKNPAFQFYANDFLTDTSEWTNEEVGAYIRLLSIQWVNGSITGDPDRMPYGAGDHWDAIKHKFEKGEDGRFRNTKLEDVREKRLKFLEKQSVNGRKGGRPKKGEETQPLTQIKPKQNPLEDEEEDINIDKVYPFEDFWNDYGKKRDRKRCEAIWKRLSDTQKKIIKATLSDYLRAHPDPKYRKNPQGYLNGECWNDEYSLDVKGKPGINPYAHLPVN